MQRPQRQQTRKTNFCHAVSHTRRAHTCLNVTVGTIGPNVKGNFRKDPKWLRGAKGICRESPFLRQRTGEMTNASGALEERRAIKNRPDLRCKSSSGATASPQVLHALSVLSNETRTPPLVRLRGWRRRVTRTGPHKGPPPERACRSRDGARLHVLGDGPGQLLHVQLL